MRFLILFLLLTVLGVSMPAFAENDKAVPNASPASPWIGTYVAVPHSGYYVKKAELIANGQDGIKARVWVEVGKIGEGTGPFEFSIESEAKQYNDGNSKATDNCLIASFPESKYKPLIIFTRSSLTKLHSSKKYGSISYRCYLQNYDGECSMKGHLDREEPVE